MESWYLLALFSLFAYGLQNFLYKVAAEKKCNTAWVMMSFSATTAVLGGALLLFADEHIASAWFLFWIAFVGSIVFVFALITRMEALKNVSAGVAYPITRLSTVLVVLFGIVYFRESLSAHQITGIGIALIVLLLLTRHSEQQRSTHPNFKKGIILALVSLVTAAAATIISKFAAISFDGFFAFISLSGVFGLVFAFGLKNKLQTEKENDKQKNAITIGVLAGVFNFIGFYAILTALSMGPLSIIAAVHSMNFVIAILLAVVIYKEALTRRRLAGIGLTVLALILLRLS